MSNSTSPVSSTTSTLRASEEKLFDAYNYLMKCPDVGRLRKTLAKTELFRMTLDVPGDIVECGVLKGTGFMHLLKLREIFIPGSAKMVIGFDLFDKKPTYDNVKDQDEMDYLFDDCNFFGITTEELKTEAEAITKEVGVVEFVSGDLLVSAQQYVDKHPGFRISLLYLDVDVEGPTLSALEAFWPRVTPGGVIVFDEYAIKKWSESRAVDKFLVDKPGVILKTIPWAKTPTAYLIK